MRSLRWFRWLVAFAIVAGFAGEGFVAPPASASWSTSKVSSRDKIERMAKKIVRKAGKDVKLSWKCPVIKQNRTYRGYATSYTNRKGKRIYKVCLRSGMSKGQTRWTAYHETAHIKTYKLIRAKGLSGKSMEKRLRKKFKHRPLLSANGKKKRADATEVVADCVAYNHTKSLVYASYVKKCSKKARKAARKIWNMKLP